MSLIKLNIPDEDQLQFQIAFIDNPAIESNFMAFKKEVNPFKFVEYDKSRRLLMGYFMIADLKIPRFSKEKGRFDVVFDKESIDKIVRNFSKHGLNRNLNEMHKTNDFAQNCYVLSHFQVDSELGIQAPKGFKQEADGSWFGIVRCENDEIYQKALNGEYNGFSVEGEFLEEQFNKINMDKKHKSLKDFVKSFFSTEQKFESLMLVDGETEVVIEPAVEVGAAIVINSMDGEPIPAKVGEYELADGRVLVVAEDGIIAEVKEAISEGEVVEEMANEEVAQPDKVKRIIESIVSEKVFASQKELADLKAENEQLTKDNTFLKENHEELKKQFTDLKTFTKEAFEKLLEEPTKEPVVKKAEIFGKKPTNYLYGKIKTQ